MADLKKILDYLSKLELNNNREWYHNHKQERLLFNSNLEIGRAHV